MKILFIMDPVEYINIHTDTSLVLMLECQRRGHKVWMADAEDISYIIDNLYVNARSGILNKKHPHWVHKTSKLIKIDTFDGIFIRKDPPFDDNYLHLTQLLDITSKRGFIMNNPNGLRLANEKLYTLNFKEFMPPSVVTSEFKTIVSFLKRHKKAVFKPLDGFGGMGVVMVSHKDTDKKSLHELLTKQGKKHIICQKYLPEIKAGDRRVTVLNGEPIGAVKRLPRRGELRANVHAGGKTARSGITDSDIRICRKIKDKLVRDGLYLVGLDIIGDRLTEINVTSPTCVREMHLHGWKNLDKKIIDFFEKKIEEHNA